MSSFTVLLLCIQACLIQNAFTQCIGTYGADYTNIGYGAGLANPAAYGYGPALAAPTACGLGAGLAGPATIASNTYNYGAGYNSPAYEYQAGISSYGGAGEGNVGVAGELPVAGNTAVTGQVPIMGAIGFNGAIPAGGAVSIAGNCACGCNSGPYQYQY